MLQLINETMWDLFINYVTFVTFLRNSETLLLHFYQMLLLDIATVYF